MMDPGPHRQCEPSTAIGLLVPGFLMMTLPIVLCGDAKLAVITIALGFYSNSYTPNVCPILQLSIEPHAIGPASGIINGKGADRGAALAGFLVGLLYRSTGACMSGFVVPGASAIASRCGNWRFAPTCAPGNRMRLAAAPVIHLFSSPGETMRNFLTARSILALAFALSGAAHADIISAWTSVQMPSPPPLKPFDVTDPSHTALLLLDFDTQTCNDHERPTCAQSLPAVEGLLKRSRQANLMIVYSLTSAGTLAAVPPSIAAKGDETVVQSGVDKFFKTDLEAALKSKGIWTVIVTGTMAHGAVLYTASEAALRGFKVVVPTDGMSSKDPFGEVSAAWVLANAPAGVSTNVTLTRSDMIRFSR
ncbi:isochorismatase family protein [Caballeronia sp. LZ025]|uniref:isochorismatase family protein n=1 Tax=Caballeronia TaxID=1827195 RepID=UPI001FD27592|nr:MULTISPECIES: isochorismatase family protein [Caballeronia]MDR5734000.1 isochorismatase family protein [Caballeronia sp. LZ025]